MGLRQPSAIRSQLLGIPRRYFAIFAFRQNRVSRSLPYPRIKIVVNQHFLKYNRNVISWWTNDATRIQRMVLYRNTTVWWMCSAYNDTRARTFGMKFGSKEWMTNVCYVNCDFNQDRGLNCAVTSPLLNVSTAASSPSFHVFFPSFLYPDFIGQHSLLLSIKFS